MRPVCCVGSGFSAEQLSDLAQRLKSDVVSREELAQCAAYCEDSRLVQVQLPKALKMDVYCRPRIVIEVRCAQISRSKTYALQKGEEGLSLRFPRFLRVREDKGVGDVTEYGALL